MTSLLSTKEENALFKSVISTGRSNADERNADTIERTMSVALKSMYDDADVGAVVQSIVKTYGEETIKSLMAKTVVHIGLAQTNSNIIGMKPTVSTQKASSKISSASTSSAARVHDDADSATQRFSAKPAGSTVSSASATTATSTESATTSGTTTTSGSTRSKVPVNTGRIALLNQILKKIQKESRPDIKTDVSTVTHCKFKSDDMKTVHNKLFLLEDEYRSFLPKLPKDAAFTIADMQLALRQWLTNGA